jgi:hypothetical protein
VVAGRRNYTLRNSILIIWVAYDTTGRFIHGHIWPQAPSNHAGQRHQTSGMG